MEEKVRYEIVYFDNDTSWKIIDNNTKQEVGGIDDMIKLLNEQDKRIKELEQENQQLKQQLEEIKQNCNYQVMLMCSKENALLKQQLHDLPKQIVKDVRDVAGDYWDYEMCEECGNIIDFHTLSKKDFDEVLYTILEKYGVEK